MKILHIASIENDLFRGVAVVVPQHVIAQQKLADVAFFNLRSGRFRGIKKQYFYNNIFDLHRVIKQFGRPDLVVFHECYVFKYLLISLVLRNLHVPYIIVPHGELRKEAQNNSKWLKKRIANFILFNHFINNALALQCLSNPEMNSILFQVNMFVSGNGINMPNVKKLSFNKKEVRFVYIGRLEKTTKGLDLLIEAIKLNNKFVRRNNIKFYIYGPDLNNRYNEISNIIQDNKLQDCIILNHEIFNDVKVKTLLESDIFIQTSRHEALPLGILEALSYGLPCLVTVGTSLGEYIEKYNAGWVCETNANSIAECIVRCINEKDLFKTKGQNARKLIEQSFTWDNVAKETINIYQQLLEENK